MAPEESSPKEYKININPRILELLGPSLYTNIYYVLAELIANSYDAKANNVYIVEKPDCILVEDDGTGMSYEHGDIEHYLDVAVETRTTEEEAIVEGTTRKRMGRKGIGKLAALSASENVHVMTIKDGEKSGFILSRNVGKDNKLKALPDDEIKLEFVNGDGTSVVMTDPEYSLNKTIKAIKKNLLKIFPLVNEDFKIHIITLQDKVTIEDFDKEMIQDLGGLMVFGEDFHYLSEFFDPDLNDKDAAKELLKKEKKIEIPLKLKTKTGEEKEYKLEIEGWLGVYRSTRGRKYDPDDFPDNFISLLSNQKLGEYNVLPTVGKNYLQEVYLVGQLHIDLFEQTELPDMSLSNRQGYKVDDPRYEAVISRIRELLPIISNLRTEYVKLRNREIEKQKKEKQQDEEESLKKQVDDYKKTVSQKITEIIGEKTGANIPKETQDKIEDEMNKLLPLAGLKKKLDSQKRKILICHTGTDKVFADIIYKMLLFNGILEDEIIYTSCDTEVSRVPHGQEVWEYLRDFFVNSYSDKKIYVIYVTSNDMEKSWGAVSEVGAGWITKSKHTIFNILDHKPKAPLNVDLEWQNSKKEEDNVIMNQIEFDKFFVNIREICKDIGYAPKSKEENYTELEKWVTKSD